MNTENTYWNSNGKYQPHADALQTLIPAEGSCPDPRKNKALERFRKAVNCYYDLYNNGLCNRKAEFRTTFGIAASHHGISRYGYSQTLYDLTEAAMDAIILEAALEQAANLQPLPATAAK